MAIECEHSEEIQYNQDRVKYNLLKRNNYNKKYHIVKAKILVLVLGANHINQPFYQQQAFESALNLYPCDALSVEL